MQWHWCMYIDTIKTVAGIFSLPDPFLYILIFCYHCISWSYCIYSLIAIKWLNVVLGLLNTLYPLKQPDVQDVCSCKWLSSVLTYCVTVCSGLFHTDHSSPLQHKLWIFLCFDSSVPSLLPGNGTPIKLGSYSVN